MKMTEQTEAQLSQPQILQTDNTFKLEAETFRIKVNYSQGLPLSVCVEDLVDYVRYQQEFKDLCQWKIKGQGLCQDDAGDDDRIYTHYKKVYESLLAAGKSDDKESDQEYQGVKNYQHDTIIHKQNVPCFKLQTGGKLTVYFNIIEQRNKKEYCFETVLNLSKSADMTIQQKMEEKMARQTRKFNRQIMEMKKIIEKKDGELKEKDGFIGQQKLDIQQKVRKIQQKTQQMQQQTQQLNTKQTQIQQIQQQVQQQTQQIQQQTQQLTQKQTQIQTLTKSSTFIQKYKPLNNYVINHIGTNAWMGYPINKAIPQDRASTFKIKINKMPNNHSILIGIVDSLKYNNNTNSAHGSDYAILYYCQGANTGYKYPAGGIVQEGTGFAEGETVLVTVDPVNKYVTWSVNNAVRATVNHDMLADANRVFVPFVQMHYNGQQVQWIQ